MSATALSDTARRLQRVAPQIRPAGVAGDYTEATVADLTSSFNPSGRCTPDLVKSFHHRGADVGTASRHWATANDAAADPGACYGVKSGNTQGMEECMRPGLYADRVAVLMDEQREKHYLSEVRRPLGRGPTPRDPVATPFQGFGVTTVKSDSTKACMSCWADARERHPAGEQTDRDYDWDRAGIDPTQFRFGVHTAMQAGSTAAATMRQDHDTQLMPKIVQDYKSTLEAPLGKTRSYGFDDPAEWDNHKRGTRGKGNNAQEGSDSVVDGKLTVRELLSSWANRPNTGANASSSARNDLGVQRTLSSTGSGGHEKPWAQSGKASTDRSGRTVVTLDELDDDVTAQQLVHPCHYVSLGVQSKYFAGGRDREDVRALAQKCGFGMTDAQVNEVFAACAAEDGRCGIEQFKNEAIARGYL